MTRVHVWPKAMIKLHAIAKSSRSASGPVCAKRKPWSGE